jgi:hypothetical protein
LCFTEPFVSKPDFEALVTEKIAKAIQAAIDKIGRTDFEKLAQLADKQLTTILSVENEYVTVALVTLACQINKDHNDPDLAHSSVTECLKGSTIRIPPMPGQQTKTPSPEPTKKRRPLKLSSGTSKTGPLYDAKSARITGFAANLATFLILGYFLGGIAISPLIGEQSCIGITTSPVALTPCGGSLVGLVVSVIGGLGYIYYYFVKKL